MSKLDVALIIETSNAYARGILAGIHDYTVSHGGWSVYLTEHGRHEPDKSIVGNWHGDGIIARIETETTAEIVRRLTVPTIDVSAARLLPEVPWVETDDTAISELAIDHLSDCGLRTIAYFGDPFYNWSKWREQAFRDRAHRDGRDSYVFNLPDRTEAAVKWYAHEQAIYEWLTALPRPVGVFACYDSCGRQLLEICRRHGLSIPEEIAVVGVDNDELICGLATPSLSSVIPNARKTGFTAAELLDQLMTGKTLSTSKHSIKPIGVRRRVSTDIQAVNDSHVATALSFIRSNRNRNITVERVLAVVPLSRRVFEVRFKQALGRTPHQEIARVRAERIKELLRETDLTIAEIADSLDFAHPEYVCVFFRKQTGTSPTAYREQIRGERSPIVLNADFASTEILSHSAQSLMD